MRTNKGRCLVRTREVRDDGSVIEIVVWQLDEPLAPCTHAYKYRLAYVVNGTCVLRYDNERGKGDHLHRSRRETRYAFVSVARLLVDFRRDVETLEG